MLFRPLRRKTALQPMHPLDAFFFANRERASQEARDRRAERKEAK